VRLLLLLVAITAFLSLLYGIQYLAGGPIRLQVVAKLLDLTLSPRNNLLAAGGDDGVVRLWDVPRRVSTAAIAESDVIEAKPWEGRRATGHKAPVIEVAFSPDGVLHSVSSDGLVIRWDFDSGEAETALAMEGAPLNDAHVSADGSRLATIADDGVVRTWDLATGQALQAIGPNEDTRLAVTLTADGALVAAGDGPNIQVWDAQTGESVVQLAGYWEDEEAQEDWQGHDEEVTSLAFSLDGRILASGSADTTIVFWEVETGQVESQSEGHWATVTTMVFNEQGNAVLSGGRDSTVRTLRVPGGKRTATLQGHLNTVNGVAFVAVPNAVLSASDDGTLRLWETVNQRVLHIEWSKYGFQPTWGTVLAVWMLVSGLAGLVCLWGLWRLRIWSHLFAVALYLIGPIVALGLPLLEVLSYPLTTELKLQIAWPLIALAAWYILLLVVLTRERVAVQYAASHGAPLAEQLVSSQRTIKTRFGIYTFAVWVALIVILYSVLRRFNLDIAFMGHFFPFIMAGAGLTVLVSAASILLAIVLALLGALGRMSRNPIASGISGFYISLVRGTPLLVQIFIWYLGLPQLGIILRPIPAGILALGVNYGAYMTEIFRAGIQAVSVGQHEAAHALGMSRGQTFRRIVLPQAFRIVIPPIGNEFIAMMKDSSLVYLMGVWELTFRAQKIGRQNFRTMETFLIAAGFYWILTVVFQFLQGKLEGHMARSERR
jgi:polar amino acid transport system permease protein